MSGIIIINSSELFNHYLFIGNEYISLLFSRIHTFIFKLVFKCFSFLCIYFGRMNMISSQLLWASVVLYICFEKFIVVFEGFVLSPFIFLDMVVFEKDSIDFKWFGRYMQAINGFRILEYFGPEFSPSDSRCWSQFSACVCKSGWSLPM